MLQSDQVIVNRVQLDALVEEVRKLSKKITRGTIDAKLDVLCDGNVVTSKVVKRIMGWSENTFQRRLNSETNPIPMTKEDNRRWIMTRREFLEYYESVFNI